MKLQTLLATTALASTLLLDAAPSMADPIDFNGQSGAVEIKFANFESFTGSGTLAPGNSNYGIVIVTSIESTGGGTNVWSQGQGGQYLYGVFDRIHIKSTTTFLSPTAGGATNSGTATGGFLNLYLSSTPPGSSGLGGAGHQLAAQGTAGYTNAGCTVNSLCYYGITTGPGVDTTPVLELQFSPGATPASSVTINSDFSISGNAVTGKADGFLNIIGGSDAPQFVTPTVISNGFASDLSFEDDFAPNKGGIGNWSTTSQDPVDGTVVPEPGSLALLGSGLLGMVGLLRRRKRPKSNVARAGMATGAT